MTDQLKAYRVECIRAHENGWGYESERLSRLRPEMSGDLRILRGMSMYTWYSSALALGRDVLEEPYAVLCGIFDDQCRHAPQVLTSGEIILSGHANLFSCAGWENLVGCFRSRLYEVTTKRNSNFAAWHHAKALAGIALAEKGLYRGPSGTSVALDERMPFQPGALHGYNPQSLIAHLAGAIENQATIEDVWPAFREHVHNFPRQEGAGEFDGACLFWIARIVHHQIGGQPLGDTAAWLHRHFNAWADGAELSPVGH